MAERDQTTKMQIILRPLMKPEFTFANRNLDGPSSPDS